MYPITDGEHVLNKGSTCPFCGSEHLSWEEIDQNNTRVFQEMYCDTCEKNWQDIYTLTGYEIDGDKP